MGLVGGGLGGLATERHYYQAGDGGRLASQGLWPLLDVEDSAGGPGRPAVPADVRSLIRAMSRDNPLWGAPRIHGELLKLGFAIGETSVSKYIVRRPDGATLEKIMRKVGR
ncbi:MAG: hypothetical protein NTV52_20305 [Acidobacteria bacterium]|nr:hypothetical protein [Acidobacteriota bacterium]